jgi:hypothetical protein
MKDLTGREMKAGDVLLVSAANDKKPVSYVGILTHTEVGSLKDKARMLCLYRVSYSKDVSRVHLESSMKTFHPSRAIVMDDSKSTEFLDRVDTAHKETL